MVPLLVSFSRFLIGRFRSECRAPLSTSSSFDGLNFEVFLDRLSLDIATTPSIYYKMSNAFRPIGEQVVDQPGDDSQTGDADGEPPKMVEEIESLCMRCEKDGT